MKEEKKLKYERLKGVPHIREPGNSVRKNTGEWKVFRPVINIRKCIKCKTCWLVCPESAIKWKDGKPEIDYHLCKGCLVCYNECPVRAIEKKKDEKG
jgi:2-oxoacid:acceptor oxidoreductase delta subunit (pyruvate/2-ketoisovalerate family)